MAKVARLPVWPTVCASYKFAWQHFGEFIRMSWCWLLVAPVVSYLYNLLTAQFFDESSLDVQGGSLSQGAQATMQLKMSLIELPSDIIGLFVGASIAVSWHRLILRNEPCPAGIFFRHDAPVKSYFLLAVLLSMMTTVPGLLCYGISAVTGSAFAGAGIMIIPFIVMMMISVQLTVLLPAKALGINHIGIREARIRTSSNFWRMAFGYLLCVAFFMVAILLVFILAHDKIGHLWEDSVGFVLFTIFALPVYLAFMSFAFRHFYAEEFHKGDVTPVKPLAQE